MTSDATPPESPDSPQTNAMADAKAAFEKAGFSTPEGMVAFGSIILAAAWLIFSFLLERGSSVSALDLLLVAPVIALYFGKAGFLTRIASKPVLMKTLGYALAVLGAFTLLTFLRNIDHSRAGINWVSSLIVLGGYTVIYMGARSIKTDYPTG